MVEQYGWTIVISVYMTWTLGALAVAIVVGYAAAFALRLWMEVRGVYGDYIEFLRDKSKRNIHPGTIGGAKSDEIKERLTKRKEGA